MCEVVNLANPIHLLFHKPAKYEQINNKAVVAEWLRRLTRNQIPSGSVGSNPTDCGKHFWQPPSPSSFCNRYLVLFYTFPLMRLILSRPFFAVLLITIIYILPCSNLSVSIVGSVVECSPATRAARVRFPDDATFCFRICFFAYTYFSCAIRNYGKR